MTEHKTSALRIIRLVVLFLVSVYGGSARSAAVAEHTALIVNSGDWVSLSVANEYVALRGIPDLNVIALDDVPSLDEIDVETFRQSILGPVLAALEARKLGDHIDTIVYSAGFPYVVDISRDLAGRNLPKTVGDRASLTGLTFLYQGVMARTLDYLDPGTNWYAVQPVEPFVDHPWTAQETEEYLKVEAFFTQKHLRDDARGKDTAPSAEDVAWEQEEWRKALVIMEGIIAKHPHATTVRYNIACAHAILGAPDAAMAALTASFERGWTDRRHTLNDPDLVSLRERDDFKALLERMAGVPVLMPTGKPFSSRIGWGSRGEPVPSHKGARYLLSGMLGYACGRGNSYEEIVSGLRLSAWADGSRPEGTIYFMENDDIRAVAREWAVPTAAQRIRDGGTKADVLAGRIPENRADVAGLFTGTASFDWRGSGSRILPGAICEHLTSFGGVLREGTDQTPLSEFLRHGAALSTGTVCEPYALQYKFPNAFLQSFYTEGFSAIEALYLSVSNPYQLLAVGDPLCRPWAKPVEFTVEGVEPGTQVRGTTPVTVLARMPEGTAPPALVEYFLDGRRAAFALPDSPVSIPIAAITEGAHELTVVVIAADTPGTASVRRIPFTRRAEHAVPPLLTVSKTEFRYDEYCELSCASPLVEKVEIFRWASPLLTVESDARVRLEGRALGLGPVTLIPGGQLADGRKVRGQPIRLNILPPVSPELEVEGRREELADGIYVKVKIRDEVVVRIVERLAGAWLREAGLGPDDPFAVRAYFDVPADGIHQFQLAGNLAERPEFRFRVDGVDLDFPPSLSRRSLPVALTAGQHRLTIVGKGVENPTLDVWFGREGTSPVDGKRFRHPPTEENAPR